METIGDAYMIAAGPDLLNTAANHAAAVTEFGFSMREEASYVLDPNTFVPIEVHTLTAPHYMCIPYHTWCPCTGGMLMEFIYYMWAHIAMNMFFFDVLFLSFLVIKAIMSCVYIVEG